MSKRKADDLGSQSAESGDETPVESPVIKKKHGPFAPLRHTVAMANTFRMSTPIAPPARSSSVAPASRVSNAFNPLATRPMPAQSRLLTPRATPSNVNDTVISSDSESQDTSAGPAPKLNQGRATGGVSAPAPVSRLLFEKQVGEILNAITDSDKRNEERHREIAEWNRQARKERDEQAEESRRTNERLDKLLLAVRELDDRLHAALENRDTIEESGAIDGTAAPEVTAAPARVLINPRLTPEVAECIKSALKSKLQTRSNPKEENSIKEHIRAAFYKTIGVQRSQDIHPFFDDANGVVTVFPQFARNPVTGYCQPFPNWLATLDKQMDWIPTFLQYFKKMIPNDNTPNSTLLRSLTTKEIIHGLNAGAFATCRSAWRQKSPFRCEDNSELRQMQSATRQEWRLNEKLTMRKSYRTELPTLQGPDSNWLFQREAMSPEVSDEEGNLTVLTPQWRATWANKVYNSMDDAEHTKALKQPGLCPPRPKRKPGVGRADLPKMTMIGPNGSAVPVKIAFCGLSQDFRKKNEETLEKLPHLIDFELKTVPSTRAFRDKYPPPVKEKSDACKNEDTDGGKAAGIGEDRGVGDSGNLGEGFGEDWETGFGMETGGDLGVQEGVGIASSNFDDGHTADDEEDREDEVPELDAPANDELQGLIDPTLQEALTSRRRACPKMIIPNGNAKAAGHATSTATTPQDPPIAVPSSQEPASNQGDLELDPPPTADPPPPVVDPRDPSRVVPELQPPPSLPRQIAATSLAASQREAEIAARLAAQAEADKPPGKARKGRPKNATVELGTQPGSTVTGSTNAAASVEAEGATESSAPAKRGRGRPPGAKNKPKPPKMNA